VITFSGHGFTVNGDAVAVVPEIVEGTDIKNPRFINISGAARKLAYNPNTLNIFLLSMCREYVK